MKTFDQAYTEAYYETMYPPGDDFVEKPKFFVPPETRSEEVARNQADIAMKGLAVADTAAGMLKGAAAGFAGLPGDVVSIARGIYEIGARGGDEGIVDAFMRGLNEKTILPTSDDVNKWLEKTLGPVVPPGGELDQVQKFREESAKTGEIAGEFLSPGGYIKGAKAAAVGTKAVAKSLAPKAAEMAEDFLTKRGMLLQFGPSGKQVEIPAAPRLNTPAFKNWFGDSKVVDDKGQPLVVYHGTSKEFEAFDPNAPVASEKSGLNAIFVTTDPEFANQYAKLRNGKVMPLYASVKKPWDYQNPNDMKAFQKHLGLTEEDLKYPQGFDEGEQYLLAAKGDWSFIESNTFQDFLKKNNYDGFFLEENGVRNLGIYKPEQLKSVFNKGTWNPKDPRISYGVGAGGAGAAAQQEQSNGN